LVVDVDPFEEGGEEVGRPPGIPDSEVGEIADLVVGCGGGDQSVG